MALTHNTKVDMQDGEISEVVGIVLTGKEGCGDAVYDPRRSRGVSIAPTSNSLQDKPPTPLGDAMDKVPRLKRSPPWPPHSLIYGIPSV